MDDDVWRYLPLGPLATLVVGTLGMVILLVASLTPGAKARRLRWLLLGGVVLAILALTLGGERPAAGTERVVNWHVGEGIHGELHNVNQALGLVNVLGNVVFFVPLGWLVATLQEREAMPRFVSRVGRATLAGLLLSLSIEAVQYAVGRAHDLAQVNLRRIKVATQKRIRHDLPPTVELIHRRVEDDERDDIDGIPAMSLCAAFVAARTTILPQRLADAVHKATARELISPRDGERVLRALGR